MRIGRPGASRSGAAARFSPTSPPPRSAPPTVRPGLAGARYPAWLGTAAILALVQARGSRPGVPCPSCRAPLDHLHVTPVRARRAGGDEGGDGSDDGASSLASLATL